MNVKSLDLSFQLHSTGGQNECQVSAPSFLSAALSGTVVFALFWASREPTESSKHEKVQTNAYLF